MKLTSSYIADAVIDSDLIEKLSPLDWCYDAAKGEVYATDASMAIPKLLGLNCPRIHLWKYIIYLRTGIIVKAWRGRKYLDYRTHVDGVQCGQYIIEQIAALPPSPTMLEKPTP